MNQVIDNKMNQLIYNEDYSWYGDERIGRTRNNRHNKTVQTESNVETSHMLATTSTIIGLIICIIEYIVCKTSGK